MRRNESSCVYLRAVALAVGCVIVMLAGSSSAWATHNRATQLTWSAGAAPGEVHFTIEAADVEPPDTIITDGPSDGAVINDSTPTYTFESTEANSTFECSIDTGTAAFGACSGPGATHTPAALPDGAYTFRVRATDEAANTDPSPATRSFTVDTFVPPPPPPPPPPPSPACSDGVDNAGN